MTHIGHSEKVFVMRIFIAVIVLIFGLQSWTKADDISDFEIEGMSIGDSLLDYFSESKIKKNILKQNYKDKTYDTVEFNFLSSFETYDGLNIFIKRNDTKFIIYAISAMVDFSNDIKGCKKQKDYIVEKLSKLFKGAEVYSRNEDHEQDTSGESKAFSTYFYINPEYKYPEVAVECYDWSNKMGFRDQLRVSISSNEFETWLNTKAYD